MRDATTDKQSGMERGAMPPGIRTGVIPSGCVQDLFRPSCSVDTSLKEYVRGRLFSVPLCGQCEPSGVQPPYVWFGRSRSTE